VASKFDLVAQASRLHHKLGCRRFVAFVDKPHSGLNNRNLFGAGLSRAGRHWHST